MNKSLTLLSSGGPAVTIIDPPAIEYYLVSIEASNVILSGFTITNPDYFGTADASGVLTYNAGRMSNIRITNCIIHDVGSMTRSSASFGTYGINSGPVDGLEIDNTIVYNIGNDDDTDSEAVGIFVWGNGGFDTAINLNIHDNEVYDIVNPTDDNSGIRLGGFTSDAVISNNTITSDVKQGIVTSSGMIGPVTITSNAIDGATLYGLLLRSPFPQTVTGNTITHSGTGIYITATSSAPEIHLNNIYGNTVGLNNQSAFVVNADNNWWGSIAGPNTPGGDTVIGVSPVVFAPWLQQPYPPPVRGVCFF
ncbi:MAG: hypothetical protein EOM54_13665 [Clostridia bacterium]|nr:hypothetical protein [Clostridia bacterium]